MPRSCCFILFAEEICFNSSCKVNHPEAVVFTISSHWTSLPPPHTHFHYPKNSAHILLQGQVLSLLSFCPCPPTLLCILYSLSPDSSLWHASISCLHVSSYQDFHGMSSLILLSSFQVALHDTLFVEPLHLHSEAEVGMALHISIVLDCFVYSAPDSL